LEETEKKSRGVLARITGEVPVGFRAPFARVNPAIISLLSAMGYVYDCSVVPTVGIPGWWSNYGASLCPYRVDAEGRLLEVPIAVFPYLRLPIGGWFLRNFGTTYVKAAIKWFLRRRLPVVIYVHPFDVDPYVQKLRGVHFHVTRHCGEYTLSVLRNLLEVFDCPKMAVRDILERVTV
jgi:peptidoglycan/xylan/chitin deacetylase (PgdA/CDA1 family)